MLPLAEIQLLLRHAVVTGDAAGIAPLLTGGLHAEKRLAIHQRHYETSLVNALLEKFPATAWLVGTTFMIGAARRFVREYPPKVPCIAEYGVGFPEFLAQSPANVPLPYLGGFAELEWHVGSVAIAVDQPAVALQEFYSVVPADLPNITLRLQGGVRYFQASWPVDELMKLYLTDTAPGRFQFEPADVWIEVRGARGEFRINRLDAAEYTFRKTVLEGRPIGDAAERAMDANAAFDPGHALTELIAGGLVTALSRRAQGEEP
ncbi:MAG: hypothetical protein DMG11_25715 [Acidobacteria bacterium]|nr:MAG: hypothetical protein DMG11_25715 [Acidobacteriota bacterium]